MLARRLLVLLAVMVVLTALAAGMAPRRPLAPTDAPEASPAATTTASRTLERTLDADAPAKRVVARSGETLVLTVKASEIDSVGIEGLSGMEPVEPDSPAHFELLADEPGSYPVELVDAGRQVGTILVRPRR
jgi:hypothetical protein